MSQRNDKRLRKKLDRVIFLLPTEDTSIGAIGTLVYHSSGMNGWFHINKLAK
jgi:hypothetical protein